MLQRLECPSPAAAVALATLGHHLTPKAYHFDRDGRDALTWFCEDQVSVAAGLFDAVQRPADDPRSLLATSPEHPYLACLYAQEALTTLQGWARNPRAVPQVFRPSATGRLLRLLPARSVPDAQDLMLPFWGGNWGITGKVDFLFAAALITAAGYVPHPQLVHDPQTGLTFAFTDTSLTFPDFTPAALSGFHCDPLPGYALAESPFDYALMALQNLTRFAAAESAARRTPSLLFTGKGPRRALVSAALMEQGHPSRLRDKVIPHLRGG